MADKPAPSPTRDPLLAVHLERRANPVRFPAARAGSLAVAKDLAQEFICAWPPGNRPRTFGMRVAAEPALQPALQPARIGPAGRR